MQTGNIYLKILLLRIFQHTCIPIYRVDTLHVASHHLDAGLFRLVMIEERVIRLQIQHTSGLLWIHRGSFAEHSRISLPVQSDYKRVGKKEKRKKTNFSTSIYLLIFYIQLTIRVSISSISRGFFWQIFFFFLIIFRSMELASYPRNCCISTDKKL